MNRFTAKKEEEDDAADIVREHANQNEGVKKIFVARITHAVRTSEIKKLFKQFGHVINVYIPWKSNIHLRQGYAFVTFGAPEDAKKAIEHKNLILRGRKLIVRPADDKHQLPVNKDSLLSQDNKILSAPATSEGVGNRLKDDDNTIDPTKCKITMLNDDCIRHIFSFLSKREVIKVERVCKTWQCICFGYWRTVKEVALHEFLISGTLDFLTICTLECILKRCGEYVKSLDFTSCLNTFGSKALKLIGKYCNELESLSIGHISLRMHDLKHLFNVAVKFRNLKIIECTGSERYIARLFNKCQNLESLDVFTCSFFSGKCLKSLSTKTLRNLHIENCRLICMDHLITSFRRMENLKSLTFNFPVECIVTKAHFIKVIEALPQLEHLSFPSCTFDADRVQSIPFASLTNIISLNVHHNPFINDSALRDIAANCLTLKTLNIAGCSFYGKEAHTVTDAGVHAVARLPHLEELVVNYLEFITDRSLNDLAIKGKLRSLEIRGNTAITDVGCSKVIILCENLQYLDLSGCSLITDATILSADTAVKARTNYKRLELVVGGTSMSNGETWKDFTPLLKVNLIDYSSRHRYLNLFDNPDFFALFDEDSDTHDEDSDTHDEDNQSQSSSDSDFDIGDDLELH